MGSFLLHLSRHFAKHSSRSAKQGSSLSFEPLEQRWAMAGNVMASVNGSGDLVLTGDGSSNGIVIEGSFTPYSSVVTVRPFDDDPSQPTQINGEAVPVTFQEIAGAVLALMGDGNDRVFFRRGFIQGAIVLDGGSGADQFQLGEDRVDDLMTGPFSLWTNRQIIIRGGPGFDQVRQEDVHVGSLEIVDLGSDDGQVRFVGTNHVTIDLVIRTAEGNDQIEISDANVNFYVLVDTGAGDDSISLNRSTLGVNLGILTAEGNDLIWMNRATSKVLFVDAGEGHDFVGLIGSGSLYGTYITTLAGNDLVSWSNSGSLPPVFIDTGIDNDVVAMEASLLMELAIYLGDGNDTLTTRGNTVTTVHFLDGGLGNDLWEELGNAMYSLTFRNFERYRFR